MPRLPQIMATQGIAAPEGPRISYGAASSLGANITEAGNIVGGALTQYAQLEQRKKQVAVDQEVSLLQSDAELAIGVGDRDLRLTARDPDAYVKDYEKMVQGVLENVRQRATYPESGALFSQKMAPAIARHRVSAQEHSNQLYKDRSVASLDATLESRKTTGALAQDDAEFARNYKEGLNAITAATPVIGADKAGDMARKFKQDILGARALKEANDDPEAFYENVYGRFVAAGLDGKHAEELRQHAKSKADSNRKERNAIADAVQRDLQHRYEQDVKVLVTEFDRRAAEAKTDEERAAILRDLHLREDLRQITGEDSRRIRATLTSPRDTPSDPVLLLDASLRANRTVPSITESELARLRMAHQNGGRGLNQKDYMELASLQYSRTEAQRQQGITERDKAMTEAERILMHSVGINTIQDKYDQQDGLLLDYGLRELVARARKGQEDPIVVANELASRFAEIRLPRLKLKVNDIGQTLRLPAPDSQTAAQRLQDAISKGLLLEGSPEVQQERRKILDMKRVENDAILRSGGKAGGQSSTQGSTLRKPGQKPQREAAE